MSEIFEKTKDNINQPLIQPELKPVEKKPKKSRKPMSEERRKVLLANLERGRATAKLNRQKTALAKKIIKSKQKSDVEKVIEQDIFEKSNRPNLEEEIKQLKEAMKELKAGKKPKEQSQEEKNEIKQLKDELKALKEVKKQEVLQPITEEPKPKSPGPPVQKFETTRKRRSYWSTLN